MKETDKKCFKIAVFTTTTHIGRKYATHASFPQTATNQSLIKKNALSCLKKFFPALAIGNYSCRHQGPMGAR
ncbi:hypothetical protein [Hallella colorans]|uniref:hypothetical protein n=1 Tax=Hallella colorans TaxID=1703337 RepID=UPI00248DE0C4|nr:hypothetical protein [Hallella colorans]